MCVYMDDDQLSVSVFSCSHWHVPSDIMLLYGVAAQFQRLVRCQRQMHPQSLSHSVHISVCVHV